MKTTTCDTCGKRDPRFELKITTFGETAVYDYCSWRCIRAAFFDPDEEVPDKH